MSVSIMIYNYLRYGRKLSWNLPEIEQLGRDYGDVGKGKGKVSVAFRYWLKKS